MEYKVAVTGLREYVKAVKRLDADAPKAIRLANNVSAQALIDWTKPKVPQRTGAARASLRAQSTRTAVRIRVGGSKAPYYPWLDFGGRTGRRKATVRPFYRAGRYLYPTLADHRADFAQIMRKSLLEVGRDAGLEID